MSTHLGLFMSSALGLSLKPSPSTIPAMHHSSRSSHVLVFFFKHSFTESIQLFHSQPTRPLPIHTLLYTLLAILFLSILSICPKDLGHFRHSFPPIPILIPCPLIHPISILSILLIPNDPLILDIFFSF